MDSSNVVQEPSDLNSSRDKMNGIIPLEEREIQNLIDIANKAKVNSYSPVCAIEYFLVVSMETIIIIVSRLTSSTRSFVWAVRCWARMARPIAALTWRTLPTAWRSAPRYADGLV
jgi:hypothetical protein